MAMLKFGTAAVATPIVCPGKWVDKKVTPGRLVVAKQVIAKYDPSKYLLSHASIMASVDVDTADSADPKSNYLIKPEYSVFVNNNGDSWERELLRSASKSFIGADNYCFPAGTRILMSDGTYKPIETVQVGDRVINRKGEIDKVTRVFNRIADDFVEISSSNILSKKLFVTKNHPFWAYHARPTCPKTGRLNFFNTSKDFCHLKEWVGFSVGVHKKAGEFYPCGVTPDWIKAEDLNPTRDFFTHPVSSIEISNDEINDNRAELIGWFLAEGFYNNNNIFSEEESGITFALGNDEVDVAERLSDLLIKEFGENFRVDCKPRLYESQSGSHILSTSNAAVAKFFMKWCGKYAWGKKLAEEVMWLPKKQQAIILKSCIKGDGCGITRSKGYTIEMKSRDLIQQMNWISWRLGLLPNYRECGVLPRYTDCEIIDGFEVYRDPKTGKKSRPGYFLGFTTRDSKKLNEIIGENDEVMMSKESNAITHVFNQDKYSWLLSRIDSIVHENVSCEVYNIEVENDNSYVAEGVVVHNCEHVQLPELSKGKVIDVALREIPFTKDQDGKDLTTIYVDILIATDRKHQDIIEKIINGEYSALSMGCLIAFSRCTQCGRTIEDESQACKHVRYFKNNTFLDKNGKKRIVAELCGDKGKPDSCKFIDASWVRKPAFEGAVLRNIVEPGADVSDKLQKAVSLPSFEYAPGMYLKAASAMAKTIVNEIEAQDEKKPAMPKDDIGFPPAAPEGEKPSSDAPPAEGAPPADAPPEDAPPTDAPPADAPPAEDAGASLGGKMGEPPAGPEIKMEEPKADATVQELKDMVKKQLMNQIRRELLKDQAEEQGVAARPLEMENASNNSLVKQASLKNLIAETKKTGNHRLYNGLMILSNLKNWSEFKKYGYTKNDVLGILHYMDTKLSSKPVGKDAVKAISKMRIASGNLVPFFTEIIVETGRKPDRLESRKMASWVKILSKFEK